jgi:hypothetical protein
VNIFWVGFTGKCIDDDLRFLLSCLPDLVFQGGQFEFVERFAKNKCKYKSRLQKTAPGQMLCSFDTPQESGQKLVMGN